MFKSAVAMFRELGMPLWVATTLVEQADWLRHEGQAEQADRIGEEAAAIFERLEALAATSDPADATARTGLSEPIG